LLDLPLRPSRWLQRVFVALALPPASVKPLSVPALGARCTSSLRQHGFFASFNAANTSEVTSIGATRKSNTTTRGLVTLLQSSK